MKLYDIAHSRTGDKGNTLTLSLIPYDDDNYQMLCNTITIDKVKAHFKDQIKGEIKRYELPLVHSLLFVCEGALDGGVTTSLAMDAHGKGLSYALLEMEV